MLPAVCAAVNGTDTDAVGVCGVAEFFCTNEIVAVLVTANIAPLLGAPLTVTTTLPVVAPVGTGTRMLVADHEVGDATVPLNVTVLVPLVDPKLEPAMVTVVPTGPLAGVRLAITGPAGVTVNVRPLLDAPPTVTTTFPLVAPAGTGTTMPVADQLVGVAAVPLNVTALVPRLDPKFDPAIVTGVPGGPLTGDRLLMLGAALPAPLPAAALKAAICITQLPPETGAVAL
jgi:hypothetical protein